MKPSPLKLTLVSIFFSQLLTADLINQIGYRHIGSQVWQYMYVDSSQSFARTDEEVDETTVEATLYPNTQERRWELKFQSALTGETSLGAGLDINSNYELQIEAQIFDESHPQTLNSAKVMGDLTSLIYDETFDTATLLGRPRDLTPSATYPAGKTGVFIAYFSYSGNSAADPEGMVDYGNAVIESNVWIDDLGYLQHPSSSSLWGSGFSVNGVAGTEAQINLYSQKYYAEQSFGGNSAMQAKGYIDGYQPSQNFNFSVSMMPANEFSLTSLPQQNAEDDDVFRYRIGLSYDFSVRDFQIGYFNDPWLGSVLGEAGWHFLDWFGWFNPVAQGWAFHSELNWLYVPESSSYDNLFIYLQSLGWVYTSQDLFPFMYVFDYEGSGFWAYYYQGTTAPNVFYRFDSDTALFID